MKGWTSLPRRLDLNWMNRYNAGLTSVHISEVEISKAPVGFRMVDDDGDVLHYIVDIDLDDNGSCWIEPLTKAQQAETLARLHVGDTVTVMGELGMVEWADGRIGPFLSGCSILAIEKGRDPVPWSEIWNEGWNETYRDVRRSVVGVESSNGGYCAGWVYEGGWVIAAGHCVDGESVVDILYQDDAGHLKTTRGKVSGRDSLRDLVAVELPVVVDLPPFDRYILTDEDERDHLMLIGYSGKLDRYPDASSGEFAGFRHRRFGGQLISILEAGLRSFGGDSGGVYVDRRGRAVGIHQGHDGNSLGMSLGMPVSEIEKVWDQLKDGEHLNSNSGSWMSE